ncbi:MAG: hypothetical protein FWC85_02260, partial [Elusimicrobia bacterium]|nr:hypothetical protein [Elusimicrobiota bacterium]
MKKYQTILLGVLMALTLYALSPALSGEFSILDDRNMLTRNWQVKSLAFENIKALFTNVHFRLFHPLVTLSFAVEYQFFGQNPSGYRLNNIILHLLNTWLVFLIFFILSKKQFFIAFITAFLFALHPMRVEPVVWISSRKDTLYAFFFLLSWLMWLKAFGGVAQSKSKVIMSVVFFVMACLSKPMAVTLPIVLIISDWFLGRGIMPLRKGLSPYQILQPYFKYLPFVAISAIMAIFVLASYYSDCERQLLGGGALFTNMVTAHYNFLFYIFKFLFPVKLSIIYPLHFPEGAPMPLFI